MPVLGALLTGLNDVFDWGLSRETILAILGFVGIFVYGESRVDSEKIRAGLKES